METVAVQCAEKTRIDYNKIKSCVQSRTGNQLQHLYAVQTGSLQPPHQYVPWITINDEHTEDMQAQAEKDLVGLICTSYKVNAVPRTFHSLNALFRVPMSHRSANSTCEKNAAPLIYRSFVVFLSFMTMKNK